MTFVIVHFLVANTLSYYVWRTTKGQSAHLNALLQVTPLPVMIL